MKRTLASLLVAASAVLVALAAGCGGRSYGPPSYRDGSMTPDGCAQVADRVCEVASREQGTEPDYALCESIEAFAKLRHLCISWGKCMGRRYYDCMMNGDTEAEHDVCAREADRRCGAGS